MAARNPIMLRAKEAFHVSQHPPAVQFRAARERRGNPRVRTPVRAQGERFSKPSQANAEAFERAVDEVAETARKLIFSLHSAAPPRDRETEAHKARERSRLRYG
jgi:hypothetical protein